MGTYFISDTHFGDGPRLRIDRRPFSSAAEMDGTMVERWNEVVGADDDIWHLGDFAFGPSRPRIAELLAALNGRKHLLIGNNDEPPTIEQPHWKACSIMPRLWSTSAASCSAITRSGPGTTWARA
jgi:calcineurin-like phosphoesterase family protein